MFSLLSLIPLLPAALALPPVVQIRDSPVNLAIAARINLTGSAKLVEVCGTAPSNKVLQEAEN